MCEKVYWVHIIGGTVERLCREQSLLVLRLLVLWLIRSRVAVGDNRAGVFYIGEGY